jgi:DNA sulfur modification protein DndB
MPNIFVEVPAVRGRMGTNTYYTANFPLGMVVKLFQFDPAAMPALPVEERHQRTLKSARVPEIARYVVEHDDYIFSSITVSVNADELRFTSSPLDPNVGMLRVPLETEWIINDGQHRVAGIHRALGDKADLKDDTLSVVILCDPDLERCQQIFSDLNRTVQKTSASLDIAFDRRSPMNRLTNAVVDRVLLFKDKTDKERVSLSTRSKPFSTLSAVRAANVQLIGLLKDENISEAELLQHVDRAVEFWDLVTDIITPWRAIADGALDPALARQDYISSYAIILWALASAGRTAQGASPDWRTSMQELAKLNWLKASEAWQGICMDEDEVVTRQPTRKATAELLRWKMGLGPEPAPVLGIDEEDGPTDE